MATFDVSDVKVKVKTKYTISQIKKMTKLMQKDLDIILNKIGEDTVQKLQMYTARYWYNRYSPSDYVRTYSFLNSISYRMDSTGVYIYYDYSQLTRACYKDGWGEHVGFDGVDFSEGLVEFIENGGFKSGATGSLTNPRANDHGSGAIEKTMRWLNKYMNDEVRYELTKRFGNSFVLGR